MANFVGGAVRVAVLVVIVAMGADSQVAPMAVTWETPYPQVTLHEPVVLRLVVDNGGREAATLDLGTNFTTGLAFRLVTPSGAPQTCRVLEQDGAGTIGRVRIEPGARYYREIPVDTWCDFSREGKYEIRVKLLRPLKIGGRPFSPPGEATRTITIGPRSVPALRRRCEALVSRLVEPGYGREAPDDAQSAAVLLSAVSDRVAVPYLIRALSSPSLWIQGVAVNGLAKFSTPEAVDALLRIVRESNLPGDASVARGSLLRTAARTNDRRLKNRIYGALGPGWR